MTVHSYGVYIILWLFPLSCRVSVVQNHLCVKLLVIMKYKTETLSQTQIKVDWIRMKRNILDTTLHLLIVFSMSMSPTGIRIPPNTARDCTNDSTSDEPTVSIATHFSCSRKTDVQHLLLSNSQVWWSGCQEVWFFR